MSKTDDRVGPILFMNTTARRQLLDAGEVVTFRRSDRTTGETWAAWEYGGPAQADVTVEQIGPTAVSTNAMRPYADLSGFASVDDWVGAILDYHGDIDEGYLYHVTLEGRR